MIGDVEIKLNNDILISHGVATLYGILRRNSWREMKVPIKFRKYLMSKLLRRTKKSSLLEDVFGKEEEYAYVVEFTLGIDAENGITAIAITHERDSFKKGIGREMVKGRVRRMRGDLEWTDDNGIVHQGPYDPIPKFIEVEQSD